MDPALPCRGLTARLRAMMRKRQTVLGCWLGGVLVVASAISGCEDKRRHLPSEAVGFAEGDALVAADAAPADVVRAFLGVLGEAQSARERGLTTADDKAAYDVAMGAVRSLAAEDAIFNTLSKDRSGTVPKDITKDAAVTILTESWVSIAAYYSDGFDYDSLKVASENPANAGTLRATVVAVRPEDRARLAAIEESVAAARADGGGESAAQGASAYGKLIRARSLAASPAFNVPVEALFSVVLRKVGESWRVESLSIGPKRGQPVPPRPPIVVSPAATQPSGAGGVTRP